MTSYITLYVYILILILCKNSKTLPDEYVWALIFSSPEHKVLRVSYCDHSPSVGVRHPSVICSHFLVYTLASTNMNQSAPNFVQMYMTIRSQMSLIMELIGTKLFELSALELENLPYLILFTL